MSNLVCIDCSGRISSQSRTGLCRSCACKRQNSDPSFAARRAAGIRERFKDPATRLKAAQELRERHMEARRRPDVADRLSRALALARARSFDPDGRANFLASRAAAGRKRSETVLAWCPPEYRDGYRTLTRVKGKSARDAKRIVLKRIDDDKRARLAATKLSDIRHFLSRFTPVLPRENGWLYGTAIISTDELVRRALNKGYNAEGMAA